MATQKTKFGLFREFIVDRLRKPTKHPEFILYFVFIIIGVGAIDIWAALYLVSHHSKEIDEVGPEIHNLSKYQHVQISVIGFSIILILAGGIDLIFCKISKIRKIIQLSALIIIILGIILFFVLFNVTSGFGFFVSITFSLFSLLVWWIANAENASLIEDDFVDIMSGETKKLGNTLTDLEHG